MAIRPKPQQLQAKADVRRIDALIEKGGSVATAEQPDKKVSLQLRPTTDIIDRIDRIRARSPKPTRPSRHAWIMQAILDKLEAENKPTA